MSQHETATPETLDKLWSMMKGVGVAMLTTEDDGELRARPMAASQDGFDGTLWFFTRRDSAKVDEVQEDRHVGVTYADAGKQDYVSLTGTATLVTDRAAIDAHWSEAVKVWFPKGKDDPELALLKVTVTAAEYWDAPNSTMLHAYGYLKSVLTGKAPEPGGNAKVDF